MNHLLRVSELQANEIDLIADYWLKSDPIFLKSIGVDLAKLPNRSDFKQMLIGQLQKPIKERNAYCLILKFNEMAIGHCNTNPTKYGDHAYMHLHIWDKKNRAQGHGQKFIQLSIEKFFTNLKINILYAQPFAKNDAPNKILEKAGFQLIEEIEIVPGSINCNQQVKKWKMTTEMFGRK